MMSRQQRIAEELLRLGTAKPEHRTAAIEKLTADHGAGFAQLVVNLADGMRLMADNERQIAAIPRRGKKAARLKRAGTKTK